MRVVIWTHGGPRIGLGHVRRCLSLAQALSARGATCSFIVNDERKTVDMIQWLGFPAKEVDERLSGEALTAIEGLHPDAVVADSYDLSTDDLAGARRVATLIVIDDLADRELPADVIVNCAPNASERAYRALPSTRFLLGPEYALLPPEFADLPVRRINNRVRIVMVTLGGGDPRNLTAPIVRRVREALPDDSLDVVLGPLTGECDCGPMDNVLLHRYPPSMRDLMLGADLAISAGGQTTYELAATGTPAVLMSVASNQIPQSIAWDAAGAFVYAGDAGDPEMAPRMVQVARKLVSDDRLRCAMSERSRSLVDGRGAERVANAVLGR